MSTVTLDVLPLQRETELRLFGPDILVHHGEPVYLPFDGPRELLALLLLDTDRQVSAGEFLHAMDLSHSDRADTQSKADQLNAALAGTGLSVTAEVGLAKGPALSGEARFITDHIYRLTGSPLAIDLDLCGELVDQALSATEATEAARYASAASRLVHGNALEGLIGPHFEQQRQYLNHTREELSTLALRLALLTVHGRAAGAVPDGLEEVAAELPRPDKSQAEQSDLWRLARMPRHWGVRDVQEDFLQSMEGEPVGNRWGLPTPDPMEDTPPARGQSTPGEMRRTSIRITRGLGVTILPVSIFLGAGHDSPTVENAVSQLLTELGMAAFGHEPPVIGSWYRDLWARTRKQTAHLTPEQIAAELERKLRIEVFDKAQAVIDNQQATGAAALIAALQGEDRACVRVGSILVLKIDGLVLVNNLTQLQLSWLERNQALLRDPEGLLSGLDELATLEQSAVAETPGG